MNASLQASGTEARRRRSVSGYVARHGTLADRRRRSRGAARTRVKAHTKRPLTPEQRRREGPQRRSPLARVAAAVAAVLGSAAAHAAIVAIGIVTAALAVDSGGPDTDRVTIQVQEHAKPEPKPEPKPKEPEPQEQVPIQKVGPPEAKAEPEPVEEQAKEPPKAAPLRVVGISLESTVDGAGGPAFAVGSTRMGETAERAEDPNKKVEPDAVAPEKPQVAPMSAAAAGNRVASRIPTAKVEMKMPKRKRSLEPPYPATLKSQGVEADVTVMVTIDETGKVTSVKLIAPSPYPEFNEAARTTALAQEYEPALRDGVPVPYTLTYRYRFRVKD